MHNSLAGFHPDLAAWFAEEIGEPTPVQQQGWPVILSGRNALLAAPTGTGKTLAAFFSAIDSFYRQKRSGEIPKGLSILYLSPLKSLTNDMYHNLLRPLRALGLDGEIKVAVRNSDTPANERAKMTRHPPHILLTTPESLFVLLTSKGGREMLGHVETVIVDELHALLDSKRGTHMTLSLERLEALCDHPLQRIGLSATVNPLQRAAHFLGGNRDGNPREVEIVAPPTSKKVTVQVTSPVEDMRVLPEGTIWPELCKTIYDLAKEVRTTLVFLNHRAPCEKVAHGINALYGGTFALTHHGCISREQRLEAEQKLKSGTLRCLCATSSMELGIDVGEVDLVLQVASPPTVASGMQRMGRAGHSPRSVSVMHLLPRTAADTLACGFIAQNIAAGAIEEAVIPMNCLDVLAQHCTSMAATAEWQVAEMLDLARGAYPYTDLTLDELQRVLSMLYGDYEHRDDKPVYPRIKYDRINMTVSAAPSSRMLAVMSGGTIPDRGYYTVVLQDGTRLGELDEVFVFESRLGDRFMLGAFAWQIERVDRDRVFVRPASPSGATSPFWQGDWNGRKFFLGKRIGAAYALLEEQGSLTKLIATLEQSFFMESHAAANAARLVTSQLDANGCLPTDKRIVVEHFRDDIGNASAIIYMSYGGRVNLGLLMLLENIMAADDKTVQFMQNEDGLLLHGMDNTSMPTGLLYRLPKEGIVELLEKLVPRNPLFPMVFRYNASRALMMGMRKKGRVPLWVQRLRGDEALQRAFDYPDHPLLVETLSDCMHNYLDLDGIQEVIRDIHSGRITVQEVHHRQPSPMAIEYQRMFEGMMMYEDPYPERSRSSSASVQVETQPVVALPPSKEDLDRVMVQQHPVDEEGVHRLLMISGDLRAGDSDIDPELLKNLAEQGRVLYIEPGLWIAAEQEELYTAAFAGDNEAMQRIIRRCLRYRGADNAEGIADRYALEPDKSQAMLDNLVIQGVLVPWDDLLVHRDVYERASGFRRSSMRSAVVTAPPERYAAYLARQIAGATVPGENLEEGLRHLAGVWLPYERWEDLVLPARTVRYNSRMLDSLLQNGSFTWRLDGEGSLRFDLPDVNAGSTEFPKIAENTDLSAEEQAVLEMLRQRGALFSAALIPAVGREKLPEALLNLVRRGLITNDSLKPVRSLGAKPGEGKAKVKERIAVLEAGRWEALREVAEPAWEECLRVAMLRWGILCRETAQRENIPWGRALETLRIWEYTGYVRRGYFVRGLSGAQFILNETAPQMIGQLANPTEEYACLCACDPAQAYGNILPHGEGAAFVCIPSTAVILKGGRLTMVVEKNGASMRLLDEQPLAALQCFVTAFKQSRIWPKRTRITVKNPEPLLADVLLGAGFSRTMMDYVLYRN